MIFLTVGTQLPFDRFVQAVDAIAERLRLQIFGQVGHGHYIPRHMSHASVLSPPDFERKVAECDILLAHAGVGGVLTAQRHRKPVILFPRLAALNEHRNDHQLETCDRMEGMPGVYVTRTVSELETVLSQPNLSFEANDVAVERRQELIRNLRSYLESHL